MTMECEGSKKEVAKCLHARTNEERMNTVQPVRKIRDYFKVE
jgi:hypothetical protein